MIHFKDQVKFGFSIIEVMITIAFVGIVLTALSSLYSTLLNRTSTEHQTMSRIFYIRNLFFDPKAVNDLKQNKNITKELSDPATKLNFELKNVSDKSSLSKKFDNISLVNSTGSWQSLLRERKETLVSLIYIPPTKKK